MSEKKIVKTTCKSCHGGCGVLVTVEDGIITHIEGNPDSLTGGTMCAKGLSSIQHIDNPYRLKYPLKRMGKKGEGKWQRISWDEALDTTAEKMKEAIKKYGTSSIGISQGTGRGCNEYTQRLARSIGTLNVITPGYVCHRPRMIMYGQQVTGYGRLYCDYHGWGGEFPKTQMILAKQLEISSADSEMAYWFLNSLNHVKNLIVIDPRATAFTSRATLWLQIRPGTDAALLLGMMNVIINEGLYDKEFVENWTYGFDKLKERVQEYPPQRVAEITWIPEENIVKAARMFAVDTPGTIQVGSSVERQANSGQNLRAVVCLLALTGNIERPGSMMSWVLPDTGLRENFVLEIPATDEMVKETIGGDKYKIAVAGSCHSDTVIKQIVEGNSKIKVWFGIAGQQIVHLANTKVVQKAFESEDFFLVQLDQFMGPQAEYADIVLPAAHWLEIDDIYDMHPRFFWAAHNKAVEPPGEAWADNKAVLELGRRVAPKYWPWKNVEEMLDYQLRYGNITWKEFSEKVVVARTGKEQIYYKYKTDYWRKGGGFPTPSGKIELYSTILEGLGYDPLPYFREPGESPYSTPELAKEFPLVLTTGYRQPFYFLGQYRNIPWLRSFLVYPIVQINPETGKKLGIEDGDWVWIESPRGRIRQVARLFPGIDPRVVMATANCFYSEEPGPLHGLFISNPNVLTSNEHFDPMFGSPDLTCLLCKVYKVEKKDMKDLPKGAYKLVDDGDIGTVPFGQEVKKHKK